MTEFFKNKKKFITQQSVNKYNYFVIYSDAQYIGAKSNNNYNKYY